MNIVKTLQPSFKKVRDFLQDDYSKTIDNLAAVINRVETIADEAISLYREGILSFEPDTPVEFKNRVRIIPVSEDKIKAVVLSEQHTLLLNHFDNKVAQLNKRMNAIDLDHCDSFRDIFDALKEMIRLPKYTESSIKLMDDLSDDVTVSETYKNWRRKLGENETFFFEYG